MPASDLPVMRGLRLKGRATPVDIAGATGLDPADVTQTIEGLVAAGEAREMRGAFMLLPPARERLEVLLADERATIDKDAVALLYDQFTAVNGEFKTLAHDWQEARDQAVLDRLPGIHARVKPITDRLGELVPRLAPYGDRLATALARVQRGDSDWLLKPLIDSYHTVWFELHEELISLAGRTRRDEAAAGRAQ